MTSASAARVGKSIEVALPYVGGTQDEKMYRVVMDRERWFQVVMGEKYATDELSTERGAQRVPLPEVVSKELTMREGSDEEQPGAPPPPRLTDAVVHEGFNLHASVHGR